MKGFKRFLFLFLGVVVIFFLFLIWYQYRYSMDVVEPYEINSPNLKKKLVIATQGSNFKDKLTEGIVNHYASNSVYIKVIDITTLNDIEPKDFDALVIIHTWENWKPPAVVKMFIDRNKTIQDRIVVVTTSGEGSYKMEDVDAIVGASVQEDAPKKVLQIISRLESILN